MVMLGHGTAAGNVEGARGLPGLPGLSGLDVGLIGWTPTQAVLYPRTDSAPSASTPSASAKASNSANALTGSILGIVTDSLHGAVLSEAVVAVVQLPRRSALTSAQGAFRIDSLPPGRYTLEVSHAVLDTIGLRVLSDTVVVRAGETQTIDLSVPSASTVIASVCTPLQRKLGPAALFGQVLDADTDQPVSGADVSVAWLETTVDAVRGVVTGPRVRKAVTLEDGTYRLCGLPFNIQATLQASRDSARTAEVRFTTSDEPMNVRYLRLGAPVRTVQVVDSAAVHGEDVGRTAKFPSATLLSGSAVITGVVTNRGGVPISGARVTVPGTTAMATAGTDGRFTMSGVPTGTQMVDVRQLGYEPVQLSIDVRSRGPNQLVARLGTTTVPELTKVAVTAKKKSELESTGFEKRRAIGIGRYMTEQDIEKMQAPMLSDALRRMPGLYVVGTGASMTMYNRRDNGCVRYVIDQHPSDATEGVSLDEVLRPDDVLGIEYYQPSEVPEALNFSRNEGCAILVIWTRNAVKDRSAK